jgi:hypothetical protein
LRFKRNEQQELWGRVYILRFEPVTYNHNGF